MVKIFMVYNCSKQFIRDSADPILSIAIGTIPGKKRADGILEQKQNELDPILSQIQPEISENCLEHSNKAG